MNYIIWTLEKINDYLKDKEKERGVDPKELLVLSEFIREHKFKSMFDLGTFYGVSGYIIGTSSPNTKTLVSSDISEIELALGRNKSHKYDYKDYGKYLPKDALFIKGDFRLIMDDILKQYKPEFAFIDDGHTSRAVGLQLEICWKNKIKYIAIHDTNLRKVRRAINFSITRNYYKILFEVLDACKEDKKKGITFMELGSE